MTFTADKRRRARVHPSWMEAHAYPAPVVPDTRRVRERLRKRGSVDSGGGLVAKSSLSRSSSPFPQWKCRRDREPRACRVLSSSSRRIFLPVTREIRNRLRLEGIHSSGDKFCPAHFAHAIRDTSSLSPPLSIPLGSISFFRASLFLVPLPISLLLPLFPIHTFPSHLPFLTRFDQGRECVTDHTLFALVDFGRRFRRTALSGAQVHAGELRDK